SEIERLQRDGLSEEEWQEVKRLLRDNDALWAKENCFWMAMIANYSKWGWSLNGLTQRQAKLEKIRKEEVQELLKQLIQTTRHTAVTVANKQLMG
ncbi:MAG: hypothetical protein KDK78_00285, partial [Chlamydiia bacterium]|nr:hypothetical protein [Chlamydiia bacterium]